MFLHYLIISITRDANYSGFCGIIPIFKANFRITISNVKITANNNLKMVPDQITGVTPTSTPVIPITGSKLKTDWFVRYLLEKR